MFEEVSSHLPCLEILPCASREQPARVSRVCRWHLRRRAGGKWLSRRTGLCRPWSSRAAQAHAEETLSSLVENDGLAEVHLPWIDTHAPLPLLASLFTPTHYATHTFSTRTKVSFLAYSWPHTAHPSRVHTRPNPCSHLTTPFTPNRPQHQPTPCPNPPPAPTHPPIRAPVHTLPYPVHTYPNLFTPTPTLFTPNPTLCTPYPTPVHTLPKHGHTHPDPVHSCPHTQSHNAQT